MAENLSNGYELGDADIPDIVMRISEDGTSIIIDAVDESIDFIQDFIK